MELPKGKILVVEDCLINQKLIEAILKRMGYDVVIVSNGLEAVKEVRRDCYDMIFMDMQMPVMDGYDATRMIKDGDHNNIAVVALTANTLTGDREKCLDAGCDDFMAKPIDRTVLSHMLEQYCKSDCSV